MSEFTRSGIEEALERANCEVTRLRVENEKLWKELINIRAWKAAAMQTVRRCLPAIPCRKGDCSLLLFCHMLVNESESGVPEIKT